MSLHDVVGDDGAEKALFGNKWTNNYDAGFVYTAAAGSAAATITVFDGTGAAWVYTGCGGNWCAPPGQHAILEANPTDPCGLAWIQPDGVTYYFHDDNNGGGSCGIQPALKGRLYEILGRNSNNTITLNVTFDSGGTGAENVSQIQAQHSDGESLTMTFAKIGSYNDMTSITLPKSMGTLNYIYDVNGNLIEVDKPGNGTVIPTVPSGHQAIPKGSLPEIYTYRSGSLMYWILGPRTALAYWQCGQCNAPSDGGDLLFNYDSSNRLSSWQANGVLNPAGGPSDGLNTTLQSGPATGWANFDTGSFTYTSGQTIFGDTSHHGSKWVFISNGAVTALGPWNGGQYLITTQTLNSDLSVIASVDPNGNETDYKYDTGGDLVEKIDPSNGQFHPTTLYSYDNQHNLLSYCDPAATNALKENNLSSPGQTPCPTTASSSAGATVTYAYNKPAVEPYGCVSDLYKVNSTASTYHTTLSYGGNCGNGLPIQVQGAPITQSYNSSTRQPVQNFTFDSYGDTLTYGTGNGQWGYTYDKLNRVITTTDPDGVTSYVCYNDDGTISSTTSAKQYAVDGVACGTDSTNYTYDADGDVLTRSQHYGNVGRSVTKYYDGFDRLVEVKTPSDGHIDSGNPTYTRYIYDLTENQKTLTIGNSAPYAAHGNIYKTQECRATSCANNFTDLNGDAYDALNRPTARYQYSPTTPGSVAPASPAPGTNPGPLGEWQSFYDGSGQLGLLSSSSDAMGVTSSFTYNALNELSTESFSDGTPTGTFTYDANGRVGTAQNSVGKDTYLWNLDGTLASDTEGGNIKNPATITYGYYPDGKRQSLNIADPGATFNQTRQYAYRTDGQRTYLNVVGLANPFTWTFTGAGRMTSMSDPLTGSGPFTSTLYPGNVTIGPLTQQFSANGLLTALTMPDGIQERNFTYDSESEPMGFNVNGSGFGLTLPSPSAFVNGVQYGYDVLGELYQTQAISPKVSGYQIIQQNQFSYGHPVPCALQTGVAVCGAFPVPFVDNLTGAMYSFQGFDSANGYTVCEHVSFDADGRQSSNIHIPTSGNSCLYDAYIGEQWGYDALNHTTSHNPCPYLGCSADTYGWDALGRLRTDSNGTNYTLHWDGNDLLFVTTGVGVLEQYNIEKLAERNAGNGGTLQPLWVYDRDFTGTAVETHTYQSDSGVNATPDHFGLGKLGQLGYPDVAGSWPASGTGGQGVPPLVDMQRTDGYQIGGLTFQGVRAYDPNTQQWTTPDGYKGTTGNPVTQRPYLWNAGNPISNQDPSGFNPPGEEPESYQIGGGAENNNYALFVNGQPVVNSGIPVIPWDQKSADNGGEWGLDPGGTVGSIVFGTAAGEGGPIASLAASTGGEAAGSVGGYGIGYEYCGLRGGCSPPPSWWKKLWNAIDLIDTAHTLKEIGHVVTKCSGCSGLPGLRRILDSNNFQAGSFMPGMYDQETFNDGASISGFGENSIVWATGNADPYAECKPFQCHYQL